MNIRTFATSMIRPALVGGCCALLAACALKDVEKQTNLPTGDAFTSQLYYGYLELARSERTDYDWADSETFAEKASAAGNGIEVEPTDPEDLVLLEDEKTELSGAYDRLIRALEGNGRTTAPQQAARAQVSYDCWAQQLARPFNTDVSECRSTFFSAIVAVENALRAKKTAAASAEPAAEPETAPPEPSLFAVYFDLNSTKLSTDAKSTIADAISVFKKPGPTKIAVVGHADRSGSAAYNLRLAHERAEVVAQELTRLGIDAGKIDVRSEGERQPIAGSDDNEQNARDRRVEITLE